MGRGGEGGSFHVLQCHCSLVESHSKDRSSAFEVSMSLQLGMSRGPERGSQMAGIFIKTITFLFVAPPGSREQLGAQPGS